MVSAASQKLFNKDGPGRLHDSIKVMTKKAAFFNVNTSVTSIVLYSHINLYLRRMSFGFFHREPTI
jgi:hypothetical protein